MADCFLSITWYCHSFYAIGIALVFPWVFPSSIVFIILLLPLSYVVYYFFFKLLLILSFWALALAETPLFFQKNTGQTKMNLHWCLIPKNTFCYLLHLCIITLPISEHDLRGEDIFHVLWLAISSSKSKWQTQKRNLIWEKCIHYIHYLRLELLRDLVLYSLDNI